MAKTLLLWFCWEHFFFLFPAGDISFGHFCSVNCRILLLWYFNHFSAVLVLPGLGKPVLVVLLWAFFFFVPSRWYFLLTSLLCWQQGDWIAILSVLFLSSSEFFMFWCLLDLQLYVTVLCVIWNVLVILAEGQECKNSCFLWCIFLWQKLLTQMFLLSMH